jgi:hypothetical protein
MQSKPQKDPYSSAVALVMARAQNRLASKYGDSSLGKHAATLQERAEQAIKDGRSDLPENN